MDGGADAGPRRGAGDESGIATFDIDDILAQVADAHERPAQQKGLEFVLHRSRAAPARFVGDGLRLGHVLMHLTANAVKFTSRGEVSVSVECDGLDERRKEAVLRFSVTDTGTGVDGSIVALLQPFRVNQPPSPGTRGRGLVVIRDMVHSMGGAMEIATAPGVGTDFSFTARFGIAATAGEAAPRLAGLDVLVVDDNDTARQALQHLLEAAGCRITAASDGSEAIAAVRAAAAAPIRLAIMDSSMPGADALEAMQLVSGGPGRPPVIAMVTRFNREDVMAQAGRRDLHIAAYLQKPIKAGELYRAVADMAAAQRRDGPSGAQAPAPLLDAAAAQGRLGGSPELLDRLLCEFAATQADAAREVRVRIDEGRLEDASRRVHAAKGSAMILGLERFTATAALLEKSLRGGDVETSLSLLSSAFADELDAATRACKRARGAPVGGGTVGAPAANSLPAVQAVLHRLASLLDRGSMAAMDVAGELDALWPGSAAGLKASLHKLDFATARQEIERLAAELAADGP